MSILDPLHVVEDSVPVESAPCFEEEKEMGEIKTISYSSRRRESPSFRTLRGPTNLIKGVRAMAAKRTVEGSIVVWFVCDYDGKRKEKRTVTQRNEKKKLMQMQTEWTNADSEWSMLSNHNQHVTKGGLFYSPLNKALALQILVRLLVEHIALAVLKLLDLVLLGAFRLAALDLLPDYRA